jgi:hypothetical protein
MCTTIGMVFPSSDTSASSLEQQDGGHSPSASICSQKEAPSSLGGSQEQDSVSQMGKGTTSPTLDTRSQQQEPKMEPEVSDSRWSLLGKNSHTPAAASEGRRQHTATREGDAHTAASTEQIDEDTIMTDLSNEQQPQQQEEEEEETRAFTLAQSPPPSVSETALISRSPSRGAEALPERAEKVNLPFSVSVALGASVLPPLSLCFPDLHDVSGQCAEPRTTDVTLTPIEKENSCQSSPPLLASICDQRERRKPHTAPLRPEAPPGVCESRSSVSTRPRRQVSRPAQKRGVFALSPPAPPPGSRPSVAEKRSPVSRPGELARGYGSGVVWDTRWRQRGRHRVSLACVLTATAMLSPSPIPSLASEAPSCFPHTSSSASTTTESSGRNTFTHRRDKVWSLSRVGVLAFHDNNFFWASCYRGDADEVQQCLSNQYTDVDAKDNAGWTALVCLLRLRPRWSHCAPSC